MNNKISFASLLEEKHKFIETNKRLPEKLTINTFTVDELGATLPTLQVSAVQALTNYLRVHVSETFEGNELGRFE